MNGMVLNLKAVASRERKIGHPELAGILEMAANEIERLSADICPFCHLNRNRATVSDEF